MREISIFEYLDENNVTSLPATEESEARKIAEHFGKVPEFKNHRWRFKTKNATVGICHIPVGRMIGVGTDIYCPALKYGSCQLNVTADEAIITIEHVLAMFEKKIQEERRQQHESI